MAAVTICSDSGAPQNKSVTVSIVSSSICHEMESIHHEMEISPAFSTNKKCHSHQWFMASKSEWSLPKLYPHPTPWWLLRSGRWGWGVAQGRKQPIYHSCHSLRWIRKQDLASDSWSAYERNESSEPRGLYLPLRRMLNSLTSQLILDVQTAPFVKELKSLLMKVKEESGKVGLKLNIQKAKIMASGPITSWQMKTQLSYWTELNWTVYSLIPTPTSLEQFSQSYWDDGSLLRVLTKHSHQIK